MEINAKEFIKDLEAQKAMIKKSYHAAVKKKDFITAHDMGIRLDVFNNILDWGITAHIIRKRKKNKNEIN